MTVTSNPTSTSTSTPTPTPAPQMDPMTFDGGAYFNINSGGLVPAGTLITVYINGTGCGSTKANGNSPLNFSMTVYPASQVPGCGMPGATMNFWIDNQKALQTMPFNPGKYSGNVILNTSY